MPDTITESDIDLQAEIAEADAIAEHNRIELVTCCGGSDPWCHHWMGTSVSLGVQHV